MPYITKHTTPKPLKLWAKVRAEMSLDIEVKRLH